MGGDKLLLPVRAGTPVSGGHLMPALFATAPTEAQRAFLEFFAVTIPNANTRAAYMRDVARFAQWCDERSFRLEQILNVL